MRVSPYQVHSAQETSSVSPELLTQFKSSFSHFNEEPLHTLASEVGGGSDFAFLAPKGGALGAFASTLTPIALSPQGHASKKCAYPVLEKFLTEFLQWEKLWLLSQEAAFSITHALFISYLFADPRNDVQEDNASWPLRRARAPMVSLEPSAPFSKL